MTKESKIKTNSFLPIALASSFCLAALLASSANTEPRPAGVVIAIDKKMEAPQWAVLERRVLDAGAPAMEEFYHKYYDDRGYVQCVLRWGADDGPDDAFENFAGWPEFHALGGSGEILKLYVKGLDGMIRQYTEAKTTQVPAGLGGMYYKEFSAQSAARRACGHSRVYIKQIYVTLDRRPTSLETTIRKHEICWVVHTAAGSRLSRRTINFSALTGRIAYARPSRPANSTSNLEPS